MRNKIGSMLLSVAIAFALWLYVITAVSPGSKQTYVDIPVVLEGESVLAERGLMITNRSASTVTLVLSGNRTDLSKVNRGNMTVKADLSKIYEPGSAIALPYTPQFPGNVASNAFVVESKAPERVVVAVENRVTKDIPVEVKWIGSAPEGFISDRENRVLDYPFVNISGPQSAVDQITQAVIEVDLQEQRESISESYHYTLCNEEGEPVNAEFVVTNVEEVHLEVKIQQVKDVSLNYALVEGGGAKEANTEIHLSVDTIRVSGSEAALSTLGDSITIGTINLAEITKNTSLRFEVVLPEGVNNLTGVTEVEAEVKLNGLSTKEFVLQHINSINIPEGMKVDIITEKLTVVVRGPAAQVAKLSSSDLTVTVDFSGAEVGTSTFRATIAFGEEFSGVGTLRAESVSASVTAS